MILSATDDKHFSTFVSWLCSFGLYTRQDTSPLCSVTVGAVTEEQGSYKKVGCACREWDTPPLRSPGSLSSSAFTVWRALHKQSCVWKQVRYGRKGHSPGEPPLPGCPQTQFSGQLGRRPIGSYVSKREFPGIKGRCFRDQNRQSDAAF